MARPCAYRNAESGFTLIEIVMALAVLGVGLFVLLEAHFASLNLYADAEEAATMDLLVTQAVGIAEFEVLAGDQSGNDDFGHRFEGYKYTYTATLSDSVETPGLFDVRVTITGPEETREVDFLVYDGTQIELE